MTDTPAKLAALVVDDDDSLRDIVVRSLESLNYEVTSAETGMDGIRKLKSRHFDLLVTDLIMPDADGLDVMREMKRRHPSARIVAMTGGGQYLSKRFSAKMMSRLGAHAVLMKPFTLAQLVAAVNATAAHGSSK